MLINDYFTISQREVRDDAFLYEIRLNPNAEVYKGHFPGHPISPGVCTVGMIVSCASDAIGKKLELSRISRCRFLSLISPSENNRLQILIQIEVDNPEEYKLISRVVDPENGEKLCVDLKGKLKIKE